jgi:hypothetical protein
MTQQTVDDGIYEQLRSHSNALDEASPQEIIAWAERAGTPRIQEALADYKIVPEFNRDPMAYVDWGQSKFFTLDDMGEGECAV